MGIMLSGTNVILKGTECDFISPGGTVANEWEGVVWESGTPVRRPLRSP